MLDGYTTSYKRIVSLALAGPAVLVAINFRMNAFGWLAHPALALSDPRGVSGNYGVLDLQMGLQWVGDDVKYAAVRILTSIL